MKATKESTQAKAAHIWASLDRSQKHGIRFGMFPAEIMQDAERDVRCSRARG